MSNPLIEDLAVNTARAIAIEAVEEANSGHPGMPLGAAPMIFELFYKHLKHNPKNPNWFNRDRFVLSAGHGSALLYSILHLFNYDLSVSDLKNFRKLHSKTPGHPEYGHTAGVETTTGPLGQGLAMAVGMAVAEAHLAARFNRPKYPLIDHFTYVICSDGDLMEGVGSEASSLAGHLGLGKLIVLYDDNNITIDGTTDLSFTEDVSLRYQSYGWQVLTVTDGEDKLAVGEAIAKAKANSHQPSLIRIRTVIGKFSPVAGMSKSHGAPLGKEGLQATLKELGFAADRQPFSTTQEVKDLIEQKQIDFNGYEKSWNLLYGKWQSAYPELAEEFELCLENKIPADLFQDSKFFEQGDLAATRVHSSKILNYLNRKLPNIIGGSADLASSNGAQLNDSAVFTKESPAGKNIHFGIREFAMAAAANGLALHGGLRPFAATFFIFSDYLKAALRLSALMDIPVLYILTHDSIGVGEDGPTHQPVEQLTALRAVPNINIFRPADQKETAAGYLLWLQSQKPTALVLSRQNTSAEGTDPEGALRGAYVVKDSDDFDLIILASGSEVGPSVDAAKLLEKEGIKVRVVSMPCQNLFAEQDQDYRDQILPPTCRKRLAVEAGSAISWYKYTGLDGDIISIDRFGASGKGSDLFEYFGFTAENIAQRGKLLVES